MNDEGRLPIAGYLLLNALVWAYSLGLFLLAKAILSDVTGLGFVAVALPVGFAAVSVFDFVYDRLRERPSTPQ